MARGWEYPAKVEYRLKYFTWNDRPHMCFFCGEVAEPDEVQVHHKDGDHKNDELSNLVPAHKECHDAFHHKNPGFSGRDRQCLWCGVWFTPAKGHGQYHSDACRVAAHRARRGRAASRRKT